MSTPQEDLWRNSFGDQYLRRNRVDWQSRIPFWRKMLALTRPQSVLEMGCNAGWNLRAMRETSPLLRLRGCDVNAAAVKEANEAGLNVIESSLFDVTRIWPTGFDLTLTVGVLIHISSDDIRRAMREVASASNRFILAVEYAAESEEKVEYRGHTDLLWRRPLGKMYYEDIGLTLIESGVLSAREGFDNTTYWLMKRA